MNKTNVTTIYITYGTIMREAEEYFPGYNQKTQLQEYMKLLDKTISQAACIHIRNWAAARRKVARELLQVFTIRRDIYALES